MDKILYFYDEEENTFQGLDTLKQMGNVRQVCKGFLKNQYQILSENGNVYYLELGKSFYKIPTWNSKVKQIATNQSITLLLTYSGQLFGFGEDKLQLGLLGNEKCYSSFYPIKIGHDYKSISLSSNIGCGLDYRGQAWIWGNSPLGRSDVPMRIDGKFIKICAAKDYVIFTDQQAQVQVLSEIFKLSNEYFNCQNIWRITRAEQIDSNYLIINEIIPNDRYSILLSNKNIMFLLTNNNGKYIIKRLGINIRIHNLQQTEYYIYCFTEQDRLIKIDKANLYISENNELQKINEQIRFQLQDNEIKHLSSIQSIFATKYPFNLPTFIVDKNRFNEGISILKQQYIELEIKDYPIETIKYISPNKTQQQLFNKSRIQYTQRLYQSPQQYDNIQQHFQTSRKEVSTIPSKYLVHTFLSQNNPSPIAKSFIQELRSTSISTVKKSNLIRLLIQDIKKSINNLQQIPIIMRDHTHQRRSSSVYLDQSMIVEIGNSLQRNSSQDKLNNSFNSRVSQHDNKNTNVSSHFQSDQDLIDELKTTEPLDMIEEEYLEYDEETDQVKRVFIRRPIDQDYEYSNNLKQNMGNGKILVSRKLVNVTNEEGWNQQENGKFKKIINKQEPQKYLEEEILIENPKTGQLIRKIIRISYNDQQNDVKLGEGLNEINCQGQRIIGRRIIINEYSTEQLYQEGWIIKESQLERILGNREPNKYVEEEILQVNPQTGQIERKIIRRKYDKNRKLEIGQQLVSSRMIDNIQSSIQLVQDGWECNFNLGTVYKYIQYENENEIFYVEEEILIVIQNKQDRKLIRRIYFNEQSIIQQEFGENLYEIQIQGIRIIARRIIKGEKQIDKNWKYYTDKKYWEKIINQGESCKYVQETIVEIDYDNYQQIKKQIRYDLKVDYNNLILGDHLDDLQFNGNKIISREIGDNIESTIYLKQQGWIYNNNGQLQKIISIDKITDYYEEEILIQNLSAGKQQRKLIRRPILQDILQCQLGYDLEERISQNQIVVSRKIAKNNENLENWIKNDITKNLEKILISNEPIQFIEEEVLTFNQQTGTIIRQIIKRPSVNKDKIQFGNLKEIDKDGNIIVKRTLVSNLKLLGSDWTRGSMGSYKQIIAVEPQKYIEEEIIVIKNGKQERKLIRRPFYQEDLQINQGDDINDININGEIIVARRVVENDQSKEQLEQQGWKLNENGELEIKQIEPNQYLIEEVLCFNKETGYYDRKMIKRQMNKQDEKLNFGQNLTEVDKNGNKILSRQIIQNVQSLNKQKQEGWIKQNENYEKIINIEESEKYIEEEILIQRNGIQERKLIRRSYNNQQLNIGENLNEDHNGIKIVSRRIVSNDQSSSQLQNEQWVWNNKGQLELQISKSEPQQFIEEEVLVYNQETGQMIRQIVRRQYNQNKDSKLNIGVKLNEVDSNGNKVLSRYIVDNTKSFKSNLQDGWTSQNNGTQIKVISFKEPETFIEEEILIVNPNTGKQERKLIRKPYTNQQNKTIGDDLNELIDSNMKIISRRIISNDYCSDDWQFNNGQFEQMVNANEPIKYLEEEVLVKNNQTGQLERKLIRKPYQNDQKLGDQLYEQQNGVTVLSRKVVDNKSKQGWEQKGQNLEKILNDNEIEEYIEDEIIIYNKQTGKQEQKLIRRSINDPPPKEGIIVSSKRIQNTETIEQQKQSGWIQQDGQIVKVIAKNEPTKIIIEEVLQYNDETGLMERKLIKRPYDPNNKNQDIKNGTVLSRKIIDNVETLDQRQQWILKNGQYEQILCDDEPEQFIEEEIIIINQKTGKQERKLIRRPMMQDEHPDIGESLNESIKNGKKVIARRIIQNNQGSQELQQWKKNGDKMEKQLAYDEPTKYIEEEILVFNPETKQLERVLVRRQYQQCEVGQVSETDKDGNQIVSRRIVDNVESSQNGWSKVKGILKKVVSIEPVKYIEEEVLIINQKTGKQERKLIRKPLNEEQDPGEIGDNLNITTQEGYRIISRKIVDNNQAKDAMQDWIQVDGIQIKNIGIEPIKFIEEEVLILNAETGMMERKIIKKQYNPQIKLGNTLNIQDNQGNLILSRKVVENNQSTSKSQWKQGQSEILIQEEPAQYIEEEIIVINPQNGKQERKLIRKPYYGQNIELSDELNELIDGGQRVVARKIVNNDAQIDWEKKNNQYELKIGIIEQTKLIEEEVVYFNPQTGMVETILIRKPYQKNVKLGSELNEETNDGVVLSRQVVNNFESIKKQEEWHKGQNGIMMKIISSRKPDQFIEEEVIIVKNGKQERKIVRKPILYDQEVEESDDLNQDIGNGQRVLSRKIVKEQEDKDFLLKNGVYEKQIQKNEPIKFIEEEILVYNKETEMMDRKLIRRPFTQKDAQLKQGINLIEINLQGDKIVSRKIVENALTEKKKQEWIIDKNGKMEKTISQEPLQYIEEEIIVINPQNGKQERILIRKPYYGQDLQIGEELNEDRDNTKIVARRIIDNQQSNQELQKWQKKGELMELILVKEEPTQVVIEEVLVYNAEKGVMERKQIIKPINSQEVEDVNVKVLSRKVVDNLKSLQLGEKLIAEEPEQYIEEEIITINSRTGKQERKLIRRPYYGEEIELGDDIDKDGQKGERIISRRIVENEETIEGLQEWKQQSDGSMIKIIAQNEPIKYIEEEILVLNQETQLMERKLIRKPYNPNAKLGNIKETDQDGNVIVSRKIVENKQSQRRWIVKQDGKLEQVISKDEPIQFIEEEVLVLNLKTNQIERKITRRPIQIGDSELDMGVSLNESRGNQKVVARRVVQNEQSQDQIQKEGWIIDNKSGQMELVSKEPIKYIQEEILIQTEDGQLLRKLVRKPFNPKQKIGNNLLETDNDGNRVLSRIVVENNQSLVSVQADGWNVQKQEKMISKEPLKYIEEEVIIVNPKTGKQERKIIRKPYYNENLVVGDQLNEINGGQRVLARRIVDNEQSLNLLNEEGWKTKDGNLEITMTEPQQMIEEEILVYNKESGLYERKLVRRQYDAKRDSTLQLGQLKECDQNGNKILSRKIVQNVESSQQLQKGGWVNDQGVLKKTINVQEPDKFIEEEVLIINPKTGKQERRLTRRPYQPGDEKMEHGDNILDKQSGRNIVSRRIVENDSSQQGWKQISAGMFEVQLCAVEPVKYIEEEILIVNKQTKQMKRKLIRRQYTIKDQNLKFGDDIKEKDSQGNRILARRLIENVQSLTQLKKEGWIKLSDGTLEKILSAIAQKFIEEEILVYNPRTGKQERRLTRRPIMLEDDKFKVGDQINEQLNDGTKVVARRIVDNNFALTSWQQNDKGILIHQISEAEPMKYIEEEVLQMNPETGMLERKLIRRSYNDQNLKMGQNINESKDDGTIVLSRKLVDNNESLAQWKRQSNGILVKVINHQEPEQYIEEEIITINNKTGKQERKLIRRPLTEDDRNAIIGDQIIDEINNGQKVISRRIISNLCSSDNWKQNDDGHFEIVISQQEPIKFIEEEVLQYNEQTGMLERKMIRKVFSATSQLGNNLEEIDEKGNIIISRRVVENLLSSEQQKKDGWKQNQDNLELLLNTKESLQIIEEQILIKNQQTGKQQLILRRRPYKEGEELINPNDGLLLSRKIIKNNQSQGQLFNEGWSITNGYLEKKIQNVINPILSNKLIPDDPTSLYYLEEDHILINPNTNELEIHEIKFPYQCNQHLKIGEGLRESDDTGNQIIARKIVTNIDPDYNPYQDVEEITEIIGSGKNNEFYSIQKLVNITQVIISKNLNEKQPNGFIIRSRIVINEYQKTQQQGWRKLNESQIPLGIKQWNQNKRSMYQIDEDSQEHRDSQYKSVDEQNQIRILDQKLSFNGKYVEEEILIKIKYTNKYERRLQRRYTDDNTFGDDLDELILDIKYLARTEVQYQLELTKQGWIEIDNQILQKVIAKNETLQMIEEEFNNKEKNIQMYILKPYKNEQIQIGEMNELQENGLNLIRRQIINNRSLAYYKNNDFIKNKDGTYIKQIKSGITMKIPKYQQQNFIRRPTQRLSQIQLIEQNNNNNNNNNNINNIIKIGITENGQEEPAIINRTNNSDISETDKMFIKQLERGNKKDRSNIYQNILNDEQYNSTINQDKNNKSPSTPFSEYNIHNRGSILYKILNKIIKISLSQTMNEFQLIYINFRQKKRQNYQRQSINLINILANLLYRQSFDILIEKMSKNVIEFDEDDVIKYNEMLDENKIIIMDIQPTGNEGQAAEPVELNITPPNKKKILKIKSKGSPETKIVTNTQNEYTQPFQRKSVVHNTMNFQSPYSRQNGRASTVIKPNTLQSSQSLKSTTLRNSLQNISVPFGYQYTKRNTKKKTTKIKDTLEQSNSQSNKFSQTPLSQSQVSISQNQSQISIQKQTSQEQLAQIQKNKLAQQFKRMGSVQLSGTFKKS